MDKRVQGRVLGEVFVYVDENGVEQERTICKNNCHAHIPFPACNYCKCVKPSKQ